MEIVHRQTAEEIHVMPLIYHILSNRNNNTVLTCEFVTNRFVMMTSNCSFPIGHPSCTWCVFGNDV